MRKYEKVILLVAFVAGNFAFASEQRNSSENAEADYRRYARFDARVEAVPEDPAVVKAIEIEPLIRSLSVRLEPGVEAPDFDLPVLTIEKNAAGKKIGTVGNGTIRLSDFRGKKPVALTLSGST